MKVKKINKIRSNKQIWKVSEYLYPSLNEWMCFTDPWSRLDKYDKAIWYDKVAELLKKMQNFEFTGEDDHAD